MTTPPRPIIITCAGRSGATVFTRCLGLHPLIAAFRWDSQVFGGAPSLPELVLAGFPEPMLEKFLAALLGPLFRRDVDGRYEAGLYEVIKEAALHRAIDDFARTIRRSDTQIEKMIACRQLGHAIFAPSARSAGATYWAEKTPRNLLFADVLGDIFPDARFINIVRDGRDVVSSMLARGGWPMAPSAHVSLSDGIGGEMSFEKASDYWAQQMKLSAKHAKRLGPGRWLDVRFEDFTAAPEDAFTQVFTFLGLEMPSAFLSEAGKLIRPASTHTGRWREDLTADQVTAVEQTSAQPLAHFGYGFAGAG